MIERKQYLDNFIEYNETTMYEFIVSYAWLCLSIINSFY